MPVIEGHVHLYGLLKNGKLEQHGRELIRIADECGCKSMYVFDGGQAPLYLKAKYGDRFYAGGFVPWSAKTDMLKKPDWPGILSPSWKRDTTVLPSSAPNREKRQAYADQQQVL